MTEFFNTFLSKQGPMNHFKFYHTMAGYKDIKVSEESKQSLDANLYSYTLTMTLPVNGVPFLKQTRLIKEVKVDRSKP